MGMQFSYHCYDRIKERFPKVNEGELDELYKLVTTPGQYVVVETQDNEKGLREKRQVSTPAGIIDCVFQLETGTIVTVLWPKELGQTGGKYLVQPEQPTSLFDRGPSKEEFDDFDESERQVLLGTIATLRSKLANSETRRIELSAKYDELTESLRTVMKHLA